MRIVRITAAAFCIVATAGMAIADDMAMPMSGKGGAADQALMDSMKGMDKGMHAPMTGDPDKDFVAMMLPHHEGAVAMAKVQLQYGRDPMLRAMAKDIIASQDKEIATMKAWQAQHAK